MSIPARCVFVMACCCCHAISHGYGDSSSPQDEGVLLLDASSSIAEISRFLQDFCKSICIGYTKQQVSDLLLCARGKSQMLLPFQMIRIRCQVSAIESGSDDSNWMPSVGDREWFGTRRGTSDGSQVQRSKENVHCARKKPSTRNQEWFGTRRSTSDSGQVQSKGALCT